MLSPDDFNYALENTRVIVSPRHRLETFGNSIVNYYLITEEMDSISLSRVREGRIQAEKPQLITPQSLSRLMLEGFGEKAESFARYVSNNAEHFAFLKYGFRVQKSEVRTYDVHEPLEAVIANVREQVEQKDDPLAAILSGVDDGWEVCLLKFMIDMAQASVRGNIQDFRERGML